MVALQRPHTAHAPCLVTGKTVYHVRNSHDARHSSGLPTISFEKKATLECALEHLHPVLDQYSIYIHTHSEIQPEVRRQQRVKRQLCVSRVPSYLPECFVVNTFNLSTVFEKRSAFRSLKKNQKARRSVSISQCSEKLQTHQKPDEV